MPGAEPRQQFPRLRRRRPTLADPSSLGLCHRFAAERVPTRESRRLQPPFDGGKGFRGCSVRLSLGNLPRKFDDEAEAVLEVVKFCLRNEPIPIEIGGAPDDPRQGLAESWLEGVHPPGDEEQLRRIDRTARLEMREPGIPEGC